MEQIGCCTFMENHWKNKVVTLVMYFYLLERKNEAIEGNDDFFIKSCISVLNTMQGKQNHMQSLSRAKKIERLSSMAVKQIHNQPRFGSETRRRVKSQSTCLICFWAIDGHVHYSIS